MLGIDLWLLFAVGPIFFDGPAAAPLFVAADLGESARLGATIRQAAFELALDGDRVGPPARVAGSPSSPALLEPAALAPLVTLMRDGQPVVPGEPILLRLVPPARIYLGWSF